MPRTKLSWIDDDVLARHIRELKESAVLAQQKAADRRAKNVIDPLASLVIASIYNLTTPTGLESIQDMESTLRGTSNAIGKFHQNILSSINGWQNHDSGYDLECPSRKILAEVKNKWNTMNDSNRRKVTEELKIAIRQKAETWDGYLVLVLPQHPERYTKEIASSRLFEIDGASFYDLATGDPNALHDLLDCVCDDLGPSSQIASLTQEIINESLPPRA